MFVLDTNICIYFLRGNSVQLKNRIEECSSHELGITSITAAELYFGVYHSRKVKENLRILGEFLADLSVLPFNLAAAEVFGRLKERLYSAGTPVGPYDLLIASQVLSGHHTLVTHDTREFSQIEGLRIEDWMTNG